MNIESTVKVYRNIDSIKETALISYELPKSQTTFIHSVVWLMTGP